MAGNDAGFDVFPERDVALRELEEAKINYLACEPLLLKLKQFMESKHGVILDEQEIRVRRYHKETEKLIKKLREMSINAPENQTPEASFNLLIQEFKESRPIPKEFFERKQEILDLSLEICKILEGSELRLSSIIGVVPKKALNEIFRKLIFALGRLQEILAGVLKTFRGENDGSTVPGKMKDWAKITGTIILFLTDVYLKLYYFDIEAGQLVENLLNRVMVLNYSETFMGFVKVVGDTEKMAGFKEKIEDHQLQLGFLLDAIKTLTNYN